MERVRGLGRTCNRSIDRLCYLAHKGRHGWLDGCGLTFSGAPYFLTPIENTEAFGFLNLSSSSCGQHYVASYATGQEVDEAL